MPDEALEKNAIICIMSHDYRSQLYVMRKRKADSGLMKFDGDGVLAKAWLGDHKPLKTFGY